MATAVLNRHDFPEGTSVGVWPAQNSVNGGPPAGSSVATATVTSGVLTFTGLTVGTRYIAYAAGRGVQFRADEALGQDGAGVFSPERRRIEYLEASIGLDAVGDVRDRVDVLEPRVTSVESNTLFANTTLFVDATNGSDSNDGRGPGQGRAKATLAGAVSALPAGGGQIRSAGTLVVSSNVTLPDGTELIGVGQSALIQTDATITGGNNVTVRDLRFDVVVGTAATVKFTGTRCTAARLTGNKLVIEFNGASGFSCSDCDFEAGTSSMGGIQTFNGATRGRIIGNKVTGSSTNGIGLNSSSHITIIGNDCHQNAHSGISPQNGSSHITIIGNRCLQNTADGIDLNSGNMNVATHFTVVGNFCDNNTATGIYAVGSYNQIVGNRCIANGTHGLLVQRYGGDVTTATGLVITGNLAQGNGTAEITMTAGHISGSVIYGNSSQPIEPATSPFTTPTFQNSWANAGSAGYLKDALGYVVLGGSVSSGTSTPGTVMFNLPAGFRPAYTKTFATQSGGAYALISVSTNGDVKIEAGSNAGLSLDTARFMAKG